MRTPQEIISEFRTVLYWSQPNIKHDEMLVLINELEASLNPVEEQIVLMKNEEGIFEEFTINEEPVVEDISESLSNILSLLETGAVEESIVEVVAPKKRTRKV